MKRNKFISILSISIVLLVGAVSGCSSKSTSASKAGEDSKVKTIYVATQNDYPPFDYVDASGKIVGYDVDVVKEINKHLPQYKFEFVTGPWSTVVPSLEANKTQIIADQMTPTPERANKFLFSESYFSTPTLIIVKQGRTDIKTLDDLKGKVVEVSVGDSKTTFLEQWNKANGNKITLKYTENSQPDIYQDIEAGRADATINDIVMTKAIVEKSGLKVEPVGASFRNTDSVLFFNKDDQGKELKAAIDPVIKKLKEDGTLTKISQQWTSGDYNAK